MATAKASHADAEAEPGARKRDHVLGAAGSFTSLWALSWLGATALGAGTAVQGGFAVGSVMAGSGLTALWWRTRLLKAIVREENRRVDEAATPQDEMA